MSQVINKFLSLHNKISENPYLFSRDGFNFCCVYDSYTYSFNDYNVLSFSQRQYVTDFLKTQGYQLKTASKMISLSKDSFIIFEKSSSLGVDPLIQFERDEKNYNEKNYNKNIYFFVLTPVTYALAITHKLFVQSPERLKDILISMMDKCPINLDQYKAFSKNSSFEKFVYQNLESLKVAQKKIIQHKFSGRTIKL